MGLFGNKHDKDTKRALETIKFSLKRSRKHVLADYQKQELNWAVSFLTRHDKAKFVAPPFLQVIRENCGTWETIRCAIQHLGKIGDRRAVKLFCQIVSKALKGSIDTRGQEVIKTLGQMQERHAVPTLIRVMLYRKTDVRKGHSGPDYGGGQEHHDSVYEEDFRGEAAHALGEIKDKRAVKPLLQILQDGEDAQWVRGEAARALGRIQDTQAIEPLFQILNDDNKYEYFLLAGTIKALGEFKELRTLEIVKQRLEQYMMSGNSDDKLYITTNEAIKYIELLGNEQVKKELFLKYVLWIPMKWRTTEGFQIALHTLEKLSDPHLIDMLVEKAQTGGNYTRINAIAVLFEIGDSQVKERIIPPLCDLLSCKREQEDIVLSAITLLEKIGSQDAIEPLFKLIRRWHRHYYDVQKKALTALKTLGADKKALQDALSEEFSECSKIDKPRDIRAFNEYVDFLRAFRSSL